MLKPKCDACPLNGRPIVHGATAEGRRVSIVGEAPGEQEVRKHRPFVGKAGKLLEATLGAVGLDYHHITNACLCRPEGNDTPDDGAIEACRLRLLTELADAKPEYVLALGVTAVKALLPELKPSMNVLRGGFLPLHWSLRKHKLDTHVLPTWHPAAIFRAPDHFRDFSKDLEKLQRTVVGELSPEAWAEPKVLFPRTSAEAVRMIRAAHKQGQRFAVDLETTGFKPQREQVVLIGLTWDGKRVLIIPHRMLYGRGSKSVLAALKALLEDEALQFEWQNGKFDIPFLILHFGIRAQLTFDTYLAHYAIDERGTAHHSLKVLSREYGNVPSYADTVLPILQKGDSNAIWTIDPDVLNRYLAYDCVCVWHVSPLLKAELEEEGEGALHLYHKLLHPGAKALMRMEMNGIPLDLDHLRNARAQFEAAAKKAHSKCVRIANRNEGWREYQRSRTKTIVRTGEVRKPPPFNPGSTHQVARLLYDYTPGVWEQRSKLKADSRVAGSRSTSQLVLHPIVHRVSGEARTFIETLLTFRMNDKAKGTYVDNLLDLSSNERIHGDFLLSGTTTGRLASERPNLQNIPIRLGPIIRNAFVPDAGRKWVKLDFAQLEFRIAACFSGDEYLLDVFRRGLDLHYMLAARAYKRDPKDVTPAQRYIIKRVGFGVLFGRSAQSLAEGAEEDGGLECSVREAQRYIDMFFESTPTLAAWIEQQHKLVVEQGFVETPFGRKRRFPYLDRYMLHKVKRQAVNNPIQGTASDVCLFALIDIANELDMDDVLLYNSVHDELSFGIREHELAQQVPAIAAIMQRERLPEQPVPFSVGVSVGDAWGDCKEIDDWEQRWAVAA